jgi:DNA primase
MAKSQQTVLEIAGREVVITNPDKVYFPRAGYTKLDLAKYYAAVADGALRGIADRPIVLKRYVNGAENEPFFQKRAPDTHPDWIETVELKFPSGGRRGRSWCAMRRSCSGSRISAAST